MLVSQGYNANDGNGDADDDTNADDYNDDKGNGDKVYYYSDDDTYCTSKW